MGKYYDINKTLSYNKLFNFVVGPRGAGKTYGAKRRAIKNYLKDGSQFVYIRRYETEMPAAEMKNFFDDISVEFPDVEFRAFQGLFRINEGIAGWYIPLSKATMLKSIPFPNVTMIIFDEFIIDTGTYHYLPREVTTFLECYSTISRDRDVPVFFLSNAITFSNPYFMYFDITLEQGQKLKFKGDISLELVENVEFTEHMNSTRFGKLIAGTEYGRYNIENKFLRDTDIFVEKMTSACRYLYTLLCESRQFGVYIDDLTGVLYVSPKVDKTATKITIDTEEHDESTQLLRRGSFYLKTLVDAFSKGNIRFEDVNTKNVCSRVIKKLM